MHHPRSLQRQPSSTLSRPFVGASDTCDVACSCFVYPCSICYMCGHVAPVNGSQPRVDV